MSIADQIIASPACWPILHFVRPEYTGVEIGVFKGTSSKLFLNRCQHMYLIDPCADYPESTDHDIIASATEVLKILEPYEPRFTFIMNFSSQAVNLIPLVDFVFVDGEHSSPFVDQDVELYWPKIKSNGFMAGHDYYYTKHVIDKFFTNQNRAVENYGDCWFVRKLVNNI